MLEETAVWSKGLVHPWLCPLRCVAKDDMPLAVCSVGFFEIRSIHKGCTRISLFGIRKRDWCFNSHTCLSWVTSATDETKRRVIVKPAQLVFLMPLVFCRISCRKPDSLKKIAFGLCLHPNSIRFVRCYNLVLSDCWKSDSLGKGCTRNADQHLHHARNLSNPEAKQRTDELRLENTFY